MTIATIEPYFVHRFVPATEREDKRTLLLLHGTGGNEMDLLPMGTMLAPGAALLSPRGRVIEEGMPRFFRRVREGVFDVQDLIQRTHELADFVKTASAVYGFDPASMITVGYSNGANIAASTLLLHPELFRAAILFRPMAPPAPRTMPELSGKAVLIAAGRHDPLVPQEQTERLATLLRSAGADVDVQWRPGGHNLSDEDINAAKHWLEDIEQGKPG